MDEIESKMMRAYLTATKLQREVREPIVVISIHVGQQGWDWLRTSATKTWEETRTRPWLARSWGFAVVKSTSLADDEVRVRAEVAIP